MADKTIKVSDLSGEIILNEDDVAKLVVTQHPALVGGAVQLDAHVSELGDIDGQTLDLVTFELHHPDAEEPEQIIMEVEAFNKLFTEGDVDEVIRNAKPSGRRGASRGAAGAAGKAKVNYATLEHCGTPHKGRTTEEEARLVRENLEQVNARLKAEGHRIIDPNDPKMRERYGLPEPEEAEDKSKKK